MPATCANACTNEPNEFEKELLRDPKVIDKLEAKEIRRRRALAGLRRQWATGNLTPLRMAHELADATGATAVDNLAWMDVLSKMEQRDKETLKKVAKLRTKLKYARYPREPWEAKPKARKGKRAAESEGEAEGESEDEFE